MAGNSSKKGTAFYEGSSWKHRYKTLEPDGKVTYSKKAGFATQKEAEKSYKEYEEEFKRACRDYQMKAGNGGDMKLNGYLSYWFENEFSQRVESTTRMIGSYTLYNLICPHLDQDIKLRYLNGGYLDSLLETASKACPSAGNKCREFLNLALNDAVVKGYIRNNPVRSTKTYPRPKPKVRILSKDMLKKLMAAAYDSHWYLEILLILTAGIRKGELLGLTFADFSEEEKTVSITKQLQADMAIANGAFEIESYELVQKFPKTSESVRVIRLPDVVFEELEKRRKHIAADKQKFGDTYMDGGYISCTSKGSPHALSSLNTALTKLCSRNALPHVTPHGLRHQYATILLENGVPIAKISALLGHKSINTTFETYCTIMDENEKIIDFLNQTFVPKGGEADD